MLSRKRLYHLAAMFLVAVIVGPGLAGDAPVMIPAGSTQADVEKLLGKPLRISRQVLLRRTLEQWHYEQPVPLWVEFDCVKGQPPKFVDAWQKP